MCKFCTSNDPIIRPRKQPYNGPIRPIIGPTKVALYNWFYILNAPIMCKVLHIIGPRFYRFIYLLLRPYIGPVRAYIGPTNEPHRWPYMALFGPQRSY